MANVYKITTEQGEQAFCILVFTRSQGVQQSLRTKFRNDPPHLRGALLGEAVRVSWLFVCQENCGPSTYTGVRCGEIRS